MSRTKIAQHFYNLGVQQARLEMLPRRTKTAAVSDRALAKALGIGAAGGYGGLALALNAKSLPGLSPTIAAAIERGGVNVESAILEGLRRAGQSGEALYGMGSGAVSDLGYSLSNLGHSLGNRLSQSGRAYSELGSDIAEHARGAGGSLMDYLRSLGG